MSGEIVRSAGFAPIARSDARILILGSLPSQRSLKADQYYAHPQNAFWRIMGDLAGASGSYEEQCRALVDHQIALWDVLASSVRPGSLDSNIQVATAQVNDFAAFLASHGALELICFNGQAAAKIFANRADVDLNARGILRRILPSTSPAHAAMTYAKKLELWRQAIVL